MLQSENVVHFIEAVINVVDEQWFPIFVLEYCDMTLDKVELQNTHVHFVVPGRDGYCNQLCLVKCMQISCGQLCVQYALVCPKYYLSNFILHISNFILF